MKILVADKDPVSRYLYTQSLLEYSNCHNLSISIFETNSSEELLEEALNEEYSVIITAYNLEGEMNGVQAIEKIRKNKNKVPIYLVSSLVNLLNSHASHIKATCITHATKKTMEDILLRKI